MIFVYIFVYIIFNFDFIKFVDIVSNDSCKNL